MVGAVRDAKAVRCPDELTRDRTRLSTVAQVKTLAKLEVQQELQLYFIGNLSRIEFLPAHTAGLSRSLRPGFPSASGAAY